MNIMNKAYNGYKLTYHGDNDIKVPEFVLYKDMPFVLGVIAPEDRAQISYEEVYIGGDYNENN